MNKKIYNKLFKILISNFFILFFAVNQNAISKPVPPGSGEGDVPANILILLDSSASMNRRVAGGDGMDHPHSLAVDSEGNLYVGEGKLGVSKFLPDKTADNTFAGGKRNFMGFKKDKNCNNANTLMGDVQAMGVTSDDIIYAMSGKNNGKVVGFNTDGECVDGKIMYYQFKFRPRAMTIKTVNGEDHMWIVGRWWLPKNAKKKKGGKWHRYMYTKNLTTGKAKHCMSKNKDKNNSLANVIENVDSIAVDRLGNYIYTIYAGHIYGYPMELKKGNICPSSYAWEQRFLNTKHISGGFKTAKRIATSADDENVIYITTHSHLIQKIEATSNTEYDLIAVAGKNSSTSVKDNEAGSVAANAVSLKKAHSVAVTSTGVYVGTGNNTVQKFDEDKFTDALKDTSWQQEYGGAKTTRFEGAKEAIRAIVNDSALTSGANFGYGHWNSGEIGSGKKHNKPKRGGYECHALHKDCEYYLSWDGDHPFGTSERCNSDSCLLVAIGENSADRIPDALDAYDLEWGTDGNAFAQMASKYFREKRADGKYIHIDKESKCLLNYVIVIGDGAQKNHGEALKLIRTLRTDLDVKTIVVAYGGGITGTPLKQFEQLAVAGSCNAAGSKDCHELIKASTPAKLKTELQSKIRQIVAERLSFTAPSITATIQEGGSIYQAQFNYEQHGEWKGTILKKSLDSHGNVDHDNPEWSAGVLLNDKGSDRRKIWTVLGNGKADYFGDWNNWVIKNVTDINNLFEYTGVEVADFHNTTSSLSGHLNDLEDGNDDDKEGLINFVRGKDYFDYDGNHVINEDRDWLLGDIYHSQLVDVGPPNAKTEFTNLNQEAYWRTINNYRSFKRSMSNRNRIIYAGANDGMLHAFDSETGDELWGFIPPFIVSKLPVIMQKDLDGVVGVQNGGGTNPIFAVDGSPVIHDMFINGLKMSDGKTWEDTPSWRTILMVPYGRGGPGFTVLDVTNPLITPSQGPMHMFSVFNDMDNNRVLIADEEGTITQKPYASATIVLSQSREAKRVDMKQDDARDLDGEDCDSTDSDTTNDCTNQDAIQACQSHADASGNFGSYGTNACFRDKKFTWTGVDIETIDDEGNLDLSSLKITETVKGDTRKDVPISSAKIVGGFLEITFSSEKTYSKAASHLVEDSRYTNKIRIETACSSKGTADKDYDYSQLGETWSTPRIFRIPSATGDTNLAEDTYVAVMGGGMGVNTLCVGSNLFVIDLESGGEKPGKLFTKNGPIRIVDTSPLGIKGKDGHVETLNGSDISNATPASPVVITPDNARGIPWRGAMVYMNDLEGKITKFNLTSSTRNNAKLYDQTTLYSLNAKKLNGRYSFHEMDVTMGSDTNNLWLFGATGNFNKISSTGNPNGDWMQNILYGIRDRHFPYFKHQKDIALPDHSDATFFEEAAKQANIAPNIDNNDSYTADTKLPTTCKDTTNIDNSCIVSHGDDAWVIYLDQPDGLPLDSTSNRFRKASAAPTVFKGYVYFPMYEPDKEDICGLGYAFICSAEDECGTNVADRIKNTQLEENENCLKIRRGILSKLVVGLGDRLFGNIAGPTEGKDTLVSILSGSTDVSTYRRSWRQNF